MPTDLTSALQQRQSGHLGAEDALEACLARADAPESRLAFVRRFDVQARAAARAADTGSPSTPLAGLAVSIKDLFDVEGQPPTAGSASLSDAEPAAVDSPAVARLRRAGGVLVGHTNLTEFAYSGVGINPHHGTPSNVATAALDAQPRIPGGSTSGGAVSVASGSAWAALGSDTGGSIRIPAALQGLVGFKNTARLTPTQGCIPLSNTLDTACAITRSVRDAVLLHEVLGARRVVLDQRPLGRWRLAMPRTLMLDDLEPAVAQAYGRAVEALRASGAAITEIELPVLLDQSPGLRTGGISAAESWAWHHERLRRLDALYDPRVALRIRRGEAIGEQGLADLLHERQTWISRVESAVSGYDALLSPTVPIVAPRIANLVDDNAFFDVNGRLLRNPSIVNLLDGCALSLPCHTVGDWPVGMMIWGCALADDRVLSVSLAIEAALAPTRGAA